MSPAFAEPKGKIIICHEGDLGPETISINENAKDAHLAHGDTLGACGDETDPPAPTLISPVDNAVIDRSTTDSILFVWGVVDDPSGIDHYNLVVRDGENQVVLNINDDIDDNTDDDTNDNDNDMSLFPVDGVYTWNVRAVDGAGNEGPFAATSFSFIVGDSTTTPPVPTLLTPADNAVIDESETSFVPFSWSYPVGSGLAEFELRVLDGENQIVYNINTNTNDNTNDNDDDASIANFPVDEYFWNVRATDVFGNVGPFAATSFSFTVVP